MGELLKWVFFAALRATDFKFDLILRYFLEPIKYYFIYQIISKGIKLS